MNYKWHTGISLSVVTCVAVYLAYLQTHVLYEVGLFWALGYFHTVYASPDIDHEKSRPTQNLGVIGKVTSKTFTHRKTFHNPYFWTILYAALGYYILNKYNYEAWWLAGGLIALYTHIFLDIISTKWKRKINKIKRKLHL